ncbi:efflux transporter outer membrane subunit [Luteolibacter ambystomatis]|uniref:Efflux transporter outer membrane subunit n=1 Tax=Luteolibacter ambystomatis TaxID=2824561 RepID=A0A975G6S6_9BACT|nr:efflux transporter outer membrane subunit [Luteolibacter ambystomatis]QUE50382.1 efflux transporter outer membrane subunit [Luteolibacter ambystomatis]
MKRSLHLTPLVVLLSGCSLVAPKQQLDPGIPANFKESGIWRKAQPAAHLPRGDWWRLFNDGELSSLLKRVEVSNASLAAAEAQSREAAALVISAKLSFVPSLTGNASATRSGLAGKSKGTEYSIGASSSWELDLWGRLRHSARATTADAEAAAADVQSTKLSLQAQAAQTYFSLRAVDAQRDLLDRQIESYEKSLEITRNRYAQGVVSRGDVAQAETQLAATRTAAIETGVQRATLEHALAVLVGQAPAAFSLPRRPLASSVPSIPSSTPSRLLERRPDIAAAERRVAAANERIGAAKAAFFPTISLGASGGWSGAGNLFTAPTRFWSLGPELAAPILDGGQRLAAKAQADATYDRTVAEYRQTVLTALQETEDALATLRVLSQEAGAQQLAVKAARDSERIALNEYKAGTNNYLNVAVAQAAALTAERNALDLQARRLNAAAALVSALGGGW